MNSTPCPICSTPSKSRDDSNDPGNKIIVCEKCGKYFISDTVIDIIKMPETSEQDKNKISSWISEQNKVFNNSFPKLTRENVDSILTQRDKTIQEKFNCFLQQLLKCANDDGKINIDDLSSIINHCYIENKDFNLLINKAEEAHYINNVSYPNNYTRRPKDCTITFEGLEYIESLQQTNIDSKNIFCAFHFTTELQNTFDNKIKNTIESLDYSYKRVSSSTTDTNTKIDDEIISLIRSSRVVIADFTGQRNSVYFEAGLAMGLNIPVIWTCKEDEIDELSFDTRQYPHIVWKDAKDLATKIKNRINAMP